MIIFLCCESYVIGVDHRFLGSTPEGKTWLQVPPTASNFQVSVDQPAPSFPPNRTTSCPTGSYAHPAVERFEGCVARLSSVHWSAAKLYFHVSPRFPEAPDPPNIRKELSTSIHARQAPSLRGGTVVGSIFIQSAKSARLSSRYDAGPVPCRTTFESIVPESQSASVVHMFVSAAASWGTETTARRPRNATASKIAATAR